MSSFRFRELGVRLARAPWHAQTYLYLAERVMLAAVSQSARPQLFIIGLPRSGTTLVYQYIAHRLKIAYFTNGVGRYPLTPCVVTYFQNRVYGNYVSDFASAYGKVSGALGPREAGGFWNRYFDSENYQSFEDILPQHLNMLRRTIWCVQSIFGDTSFVNKNIKHLLRIHAISEIYPNSFFLVVERDLEAAALSMLRARRHLFGESAKWWSVRPPDYAQLRDLPLPEQIAGQYFSLRERMERDLADVSPERILRVSYGCFCRNPDILIEQIRERLGPIELKNAAVDSFPLSRSVPTSSEEKNLVGLVENGRR